MWRSVPPKEGLGLDFLFRDGKGQCHLPQQEMMVANSDNFSKYCWCWVPMPANGGGGWGFLALGCMAGRILQAISSNLSVRLSELVGVWKEYTVEVPQ